MRDHVRVACTNALPKLHRAKDKGLMTMLVIEVDDISNENESLTAMAFLSVLPGVPQFATTVDVVVRADAGLLKHGALPDLAVTCLKWGERTWDPVEGEPQVTSWPRGCSPDSEGFSGASTPAATPRPRAGPQGPACRSGS